MTQERISDIERQMGQLDNRLASAENSNRETLQEVKGFAESVRDLVKEQAVANANYTHQAEINKRMFTELKEIKAETRANSRYIDTNRNMDAIINKAPIWAVTTLITLVGLLVTMIWNSLDKVPV
tara:strand:+ start:655 stop:1029 length:375 start_codon:yes stop_codon:yes gene_type:complete